MQFQFGKRSAGRAQDAGRRVRAVDVPEERRGGLAVFDFGRLAACRGDLASDLIRRGDFAAEFATDLVSRFADFAAERGDLAAELAADLVCCFAEFAADLVWRFAEFAADLVCSLADPMPCSAP